MINRRYGPVTDVFFFDFTLGTMAKNEDDDMAEDNHCLEWHIEEKASDESNMKNL